MKIFKSMLLMLVAVFALASAMAQNIGINVSAGNSGNLFVGGNIVVNVTLTNTSTTATAPAYKLRPQISVGANAKIAASGHELPAGWSICSQTDGVIILSSGNTTMAPSTQKVARLLIEGVALGSASVAGNFIHGGGTVASACNIGAPLPNFVAGDDASSVNLTIIAAPPCTLAATASAGMVSCTTGTTTLTAIATGNIGAVEYSLIGGPFQDANTFTVPASTILNPQYVVTVREKTLHPCSTSTAPVVVAPVALYYLDSDGDNYGIASTTICSETAPVGYVLVSGDCNDNNAAINPGATEICNGIDDNCNGLADDGLVSCIPPVVTAPTVTQPTCVLQTGRIIVKATGPATLQYSINNGVTFSNVANFPNLAPGNYFIVVRSTANPAYLVPYSANPVVINPVPPLSAPTAIAGPVGVCRNSTEVFSVTPVVGAVSYQWTLPFNATGTSTTNSISVSFNGTFSGGNISVRAINTCGQSPLFTRNIQYYGAKPAQPAAITGQTVGICGTQVYSIASVPNTNNYIWVNPTGTSIISGQGTTSIVLSIGNSFKTGTLSVAAANCKGTSNARTLVINRNPEIPTITGPIIGVCENSTQAYSCNLVTGATLYTWAVPAGAVINSGQGTNSISVTFPSGFVSGDIKVASGTACGSGTQKVLNVISSPKIPATISGPASVCPNATGIVFSTIAVAGVTYNWVVPSGASIVSGQGTASVTVNWGNVAGQVIVTGSNLCGTSGVRNKSITLLACPAPPVTMAKAEELETVSGLDVQLRPNPATTELFVTLNNFVANQKVELTLMQSDGKVQQALSLMPTIKGQQVRMDVSRAASGYYILLVKQSGKMINRQVVILK